MSRELDVNPNACTYILAHETDNIINGFRLEQFNLATTKGHTVISASNVKD